MQASAKLSHARISAQKCRLVADQVRGLPVERALSVLLADINDDDLTDILIANDRTVPDVHYLGRPDGGFRAAGNAALPVTSLNTMSLEAADFDNDLRADIFSTDMTFFADQFGGVPDDGEFQILLGTQMIAKGLDFPNVTLVGVINADTALHLPDFRAAERSFGLVTQVAGRTGRGAKGGRFLVQTFNPEHEAIQSATRHDYIGFAQNELPHRQEFQYPPFGHMARIVVRGEVQSKAEHMADHIAEQVALANETESGDVSVLGPAPAPVEKLRGKFRFHMLLSSQTEGALQRILRRAQTSIKLIEDVRWIVDIDPQDML